MRSLTALNSKNVILKAKAAEIAVVANSEAVTVVAAPEEIAVVVAVVRKAVAPVPTVVNAMVVPREMESAAFNMDAESAETIARIGSACPKALP